MNYFELHIGDYAEATQHLSILEDGIYCRLLRKYYASEKPLPADISSVQRLVVARSKEERKAVELVLQEFFILDADGWHQPRCDHEIERFRAGEPEREAKKANEENRMRRHRAERAELFALLTAAGEHAPWNIPVKELRERVAGLRTDGDGVIVDTSPETQPATPATYQVDEPVTALATPATATQTPLPTTQTPTNNIYTAAPPAAKSKTKREKPRSKVQADFRPSELGLQLAQQNGLAVEVELRRFIDHHTAHGSLMADWQAAWRTWVGKAVEFGRAKAPDAQRKRELVL